ncbi:hypothetical protein [Oceanobacter antarcticus]|uniref:Esterase n=1 Tax=Oceanobacter antarcticus TaxID=3133425 RepID=A0ABW8NGD8_9GAMM
MNCEDSYVIEDGVEALVWSDENPVQAIVSFTSMNPGKFERWSWFSNNPLNNPTLYIMLRDDEHKYYLGDINESKNKYICFLSDTLKKYKVDKSKVYALGSSMGGYGAVYATVKLGFSGCLCINPQVDYFSAGLHEYSLWQRKMRSTKWVDLDHVILTTLCDSSPEFYFIRGLYGADSCAMDKLVYAVDCLRYPYSLNVVNEKEHGWFGMPKNKLIRHLNDFFNKDNTNKI